MSKDPLGAIARMSAASLLAITPEYWQVRSARDSSVTTLRSEPADFAMKTEFTTIDGLRIRCARAEAKGRPTLLFLSPLPQSIYCYDRSWSALVGEANLVAIDLPGFGGSEGGMDMMRFDAQSSFLQRAIEHFGLSDVHIVAPDVAMPVALHYALHREHRAASLLIGDGPGVLPSNDGSLVRKIVGSAFWRAMVRVNGARTFLASATAVGYLHYRMSVEELQDYVDSYTGRINQVVAYFASYPEGLKTIDPHLESLALPVHIFWGDTDAFLGADNARLLARRLPHSCATVFENCGHFCYQDRTSEFTALLSEWVNTGYRSV